MKRNVAALATLALLLSTMALAEDRNIQGTISRVDNAGKTLVVKNREESENTISWNDATEISGDLKEGVQVEISASEQDGKLTARTIRVFNGKEDLPEPLASAVPCPGPDPNPSVAGNGKGSCP